MKNKDNYVNLTKIIVIWILATISSLILDYFKIRVENILLIYVVGVLISIIETSNIAWGIISAIIYIMTFNYLYTDPRYTFLINDPNYLISVFIFIIVAIIVSTLTNRLKKQREIALYQEEVTSKINQISSGFLNLSGYEEIRTYCQDSLYNLTKIKNEVFLYQNKEFQDLHGVYITKPEKEIVLGVYHDNDGNIIRRKIDDDGVYIESNDEYIKRIKDTSDEYWNVKKVTDWIDSSDRKGKVMFKDVGDDYSSERIEFELRKAKMVQNIKYYGYDTLKGYNTDDWSQIKQFATKLKELTKELRMSGYAVFQLSDETVFTDIFSLSSNNIANAKQIKHVADILNIGKKLNKEEYHKYQMVLECGSWGEVNAENLDLNKQYFCIKPDKNRAGSKDKIMLFEIDLNLNVWKNIGYIIKKTKDTN